MNILISNIIFICILNKYFYFSVDVRDRDLSVAERWSDDAVFGSRAYFLAERSPGQLAVERVRPADAGLYRCRVDFRVAQTRNSKVLLSVVGKREKIPKILY